MVMIGVIKEMPITLKTRQYGWVTHEYACTFWATAIQARLRVLTENGLGKNQQFIALKEMLDPLWRLTTV